MKYTVIDLKELAAELEHHFDKRNMPKYNGQCTNCWAEVTQRMNECPNCHMPIVWLNSKTWERLYGPPKARIAELEMVLPATYSGKQLCAECGVAGFANESDSKAWAKAERQFGQAEMESVIRYVTQDKRGQAAMGHALAIARKKLRERKPSKPAEPDIVPSGTRML